MGARRVAGLLSLLSLIGCSSTSTPPPDALVDECQKATCAAVGASCGKITDGCEGTVQCGSCPSGETCGAAGANRCGVGACTPKSCADVGATCGDVSDGCGDILRCGECAAGQRCQQNSCQCVPKTCAELNANCGALDDGCGGTLSCGSCPSGEQCGGAGENRCGAASCTPKTCTSLNAVCGQVNDGCGATFSCGSCGGTERCDAGRCVPSCVPTTCAALGKNCGSVTDGCGHTLDCGSCPSNQPCTDNVCAAPNIAPACATMTASGETFELAISQFPFRSARPPGDKVNSLEYQLIAWQAPRSGSFVFDTATSVGSKHLWVVENCQGDGAVYGSWGAGFQYVQLNAVSGRWYLIVLAHTSPTNESGQMYLHGAPLQAAENACADFVDNDADGQLNCADPNCAGNSACFGAACLADEPASTLPFVYTNTTVGKRNLMSMNGRWPDYIVAWTAPKAATYVFGVTKAWSQVHVIRGCSGYGLATAIALDEGTPATPLSMTAGQRVLVVVSGNADDTQVQAQGQYTLRVDELVASEVGKCDDSFDNDADGQTDSYDSDCQPQSP